MRPWNKTIIILSKPRVINTVHIPFLCLGCLSRYNTNSYECGTLWGKCHQASCVL